MKLKREVLYDKAAPIEEGEEMHWLAAGMLETMQKEGGMGLAAPQVGESVRLIIGGSEHWSFVLINPEIVKRSKQKCPSFEGCLSFKGETVKVERHKRIVVQGYDLEWNLVKFKAHGLLAVVLQHEIDHLDGICIIPE
jgi:peptide deformylase